MANVKVSELTELTAGADADKMLIIDASESGVEKSKYIQLTTMKDYFFFTGQHLRPTFTHNADDSIKIGGGWYDVAGKNAGWVSELTCTLSGASANDWYYVYLDYSGITSGTAITNSEIIYSATEPSWSHTYRGWYNGSDRCIFAVRTDADGDIYEFFHSGEQVIFADHKEDRADADLDTTWTDVTLTAPKFATRAAVTFYSHAGTSTPPCSLYWRTNGQTGTTGHIATVAMRENNVSFSIGDFNSVDVITDSSQKIEVKHSVAGSQTAAVYTNGFYFPVGM